MVPISTVIIVLSMNLYPSYLPSTFCGPLHYFLWLCFHNWEGGWTMCFWLPPGCFFKMAATALFSNPCFLFKSKNARFSWLQLWVVSLHCFLHCLAQLFVTSGCLLCKSFAELFCASFLWRVILYAGFQLTSLRRRKLVLFFKCEPMCYFIYHSTFCSYGRESLNFNVL